MKILHQSKEFTAEELYHLTMNPQTQKMSEQEGNVIEVQAYAIYEDTNAKGVEQEILSIMTPEHEVFATNSATFKEDFIKMNTLFDSMGAKVNAIKVVSGMSKNDRKFITCVFSN